LVREKLCLLSAPASRSCFLRLPPAPFNETVYGFLT